MNEAVGAPDKSHSTPKTATRLSKAKVKRITARKFGREAALDKLTSEELCQDLFNKAVRRIVARRTRWKPRRASVCCYSEIVLSLYSLASSERERFVSRLDELMREYILAVLDNDHDRFKLPAVLLRLLGKEYIRDRTTLNWLLLAVLQRWRKIGEPDSRHREQMLIQQSAQRYGNNRKRILHHLQEMGFVQSNLTAAQVYSWLSRIGQCLSRDQRAAVGKDFGFRHRPKPSGFGALLKSKSKKQPQ